MSKFKLFTVMAIVVLMLAIAGCTGTKTMINTDQSNDPKSAAMADYNAWIGELRQQINYGKTLAQPANNSSIDEYMATYQAMLNKSWSDYNSTQKAADVYAQYLDHTSAEYRNVTSTMDVLKNDIKALEGAYGTSRVKASALSEYSKKLNATTTAYEQLSGYGKDAHVSSMSDYSSYMSGFKQLLDDYDKSCNDAIAAGRLYQQYCDPGSDEYAGIARNEQALKDGIAKADSIYEQMQKDYDSKSAAQSNAQSTFKSYTNKLSAVTTAKADLDKYDSSKSALNKLDKNFILGYSQKLQVFDGCCNDAIAAGNACLRYLDKNSTDYKSVTDNNKVMSDTQASYDNSYKKLVATYNNLHPMDAIK